MKKTHKNILFLTLLLSPACADTEPRIEEPVSARAPSYDAEFEAADYESTEGDMDSLAAGSPLLSEAAPKPNTERYRHIEESDFKDALATPLSTFSIDVDTAGYSLVRRHLQNGQLPPAGAVRIEEMLNYFDYSYKGPETTDPFAIHSTVAASPWDEENRIVRIAIKGKDMQAAERPNANLVFLIDVSGSMEDRNKLPLLKRSLTMMTKELSKDDSVGIVVYAGAAGVVLTPTNDRDEILDALGRLQAGGSTNGGEGIQAAYALARKHFSEEGINRVVLATDGDFNVGNTSESGLVNLIENEAKSGIFLTVIGFGDGNYNDSTMEQLADRGNGNYAYIDTIEEAKKVLVSQLAGTLVTIASDVKIQVEFNPDVVSSYRLIGYENRALASEDFNDDKKDAGEIGAGHSVTALYEVILAGKDSRKKRSVDPLRYQAKTAKVNKSVADAELMTVKVRYKKPGTTTSQLITKHVANEAAEVKNTDEDFRFAAAVAGFGLKLRGSKHAFDLQYADILALAKSGLGSDKDGFRSEFLGLVKKAERLSVHH